MFNEAGFYDFVNVWGYFACVALIKKDFVVFNGEILEATVLGTDPKTDVALLKVESKTVIFVTHSIEEAVYLADQVVILSGRPGSIADIVFPEIDRRGEIDLIRRQPVYMELVDEIWSSLKRYVE